MSMIHTQQMGRLVAAGMLEDLDATINILSQLRALHIVDYDGSEQGLNLGTPDGSTEILSRELNKMRAVSSNIPSNSKNASIASEIRQALDKDLPTAVESLIANTERMDEIENMLSSLGDEENQLRMIAPLGVETELLDGYESLATFVGTVNDLTAAKKAASDGIILSGNTGKETIVGVFVKKEIAKDVQSDLESAGFSAIQIPEGKGEPKSRLVEIDSERLSLIDEKSTLSGKLESWNKENGEKFHGGLELLERDHAMATAPVRLAVTEHTFLIDGWVEMIRAEEVKSALVKTCIVVDVEPFKIQPGGGGHGHSDDHHHQEMPPIAFTNRTASRPMELLTDAVGRPAYGRIDPTLFMFFTYPIFFGMMLGDMAYGLVTMGLGWMVLRKAGTNEMMNLGGKFLLYIGLGTFVFGYLYAEFAGFEIYPHHGSNPAEALAVLYPGVDAHGHLWHASLPFGMELAFPFHRVLMAEDGGNLEDLILLTIYIGVAHVALGLIVGFRDVYLYGNGHGDSGLVCAIFEKGSWLILLSGGFLAAYAFLSAPAYEEKWVNPDQAYLDLLDQMLMIGGVLVAIGIGMIIWMLYRYHGVPFPINVGLGPIEAVGMMPTVISYVRLFAVGVVGVKIAETGNNMLFDPAMDSIQSGEGLFLVPVMILGWFAVQIFAWGLGVFSPNIHAARLHFVEWMRQFYDASGEAFDPFGFKAHHVEVE
ncbi:MAG: V-type ATPase 116kDa subunit family protein [Candidatus Thalassarchaeaceae archaeon]|nr:V-type ATPase 116kDa subunit family protein [Candidatus Thalassarchaeaceae archaeon]